MGSHNRMFHAPRKVRLRKSGGLSYTRLRELLLEKISQLGMDPQLFGMHSLRASGATAGLCQRLGREAVVSL